MWEVARNFSEKYAYINLSIWTIRFLILMAMATACTICWRGSKSKSKSKGESNDDEISDQLPLPVLPNDLIPEILVRLPARSLVRFRCICKQWNSIISDTQFAKLHLYKSSMDPTLNHHSLVRFNQKSNQLQFISCSVKSLFNNTFTPLEDLTLSLRPPDNYSYYLMLDTCNGVVCLFDFENMDLLLCNPITRLTSRKCPFPAGDTLDKIMLYHGFGYDHVSDKYKVVFVFSDPSPQDVHRTITKVYAFGDSCWTTIQNLNYYPTEGSGIFVSGTLNWVVVAPTMGARAGVLSHVIHSFNLEKETFGQVLLPEFGHDKPEHPVQASLKNCLSFCYDQKRTQLVVWLMKEYGVKESWTKLMAIPHIGLQDFGFYSGIQPLCMSENGQVLLKFISRHVRTVVYNPKDGRLEYPNMQPNMGLYTQHIYLESLVSPCF